MVRLRGNLAVRLAIGYGILIITTTIAISGVVYLGTVGVIEHGIDAKVRAISNFLLGEYRVHGVTSLQRQIGTLLTDNIDQDTEVYLLAGPNGNIVGNIAALPDVPADTMTDHEVIRYGRPSLSRVLPSRLADGYTLIVGRDLADLTAIRQLVLRSMLPTSINPPTSGSCFSSRPSNSVFSCKSIGSQYLTFYWNDMGGNPDDKDYNDAEISVSCSGTGTGNTATGVYLSS